MHGDITGDKTTIPSLISTHSTRTPAASNSLRSMA
jgi:hypothetical protein